MDMKVSVIFGCGGQDGSYLSEILIDLGHKVIGVVRRSSTNNQGRIEHVRGLEVIEGDITDCISVSSIINKYQPDEIYNLAAQSHVHTSFSEPVNTFNANTIGVINILEGIKNYCPQARLFQASTSEMFGRHVKDGCQDIDSPFEPMSPYAVSKVASHHLIDVYRRAYGLYLCSVIMMNHESPRRGENFVTRKITKWIGKNIKKIRNGQPVDKLKLGNIESFRDWSHAQDFMRAAPMILEQDEPNNYLLCSEETHSIRDFLSAAFGVVNLNYEDWIEIDKNLIRPAEVDYLRGKMSDSAKQLDWKPLYNFDGLVTNMVVEDIRLYE